MMAGCEREIEPRLADSADGCFCGDTVASIDAAQFQRGVWSGVLRRCLFSEEARLVASNDYSGDYRCFDQSLLPVCV